MSKKKILNKAFVNVRGNENKSEPILSSTEQQRRPVLGISYAKLTGQRSLKECIKQDNKNSSSQIVQELTDLQNDMTSCNTIMDFLKRYSTHNKEYDQDNKALKAMQSYMRRNFDKEFDERIRHIHTKANGKGAFVLFGFVFYNVFESLNLTTITAFDK